ENAVIAKLPGHRWANARARVRTGRLVARGAEFFHLDEGREEVANLVGEVGVLFDVLRQGGALAAAQAFGELLGQFFQRLATGTDITHDGYPPGCPACR